MSVRTLAKILLSIGVALATAELALHAFPRFLPERYLAAYPANGAEFLHPDLFARTPVEGVLLPARNAAQRGPPPADLIELGVAPRTADDDARAFPEVELPSDALGLPNPRALEHADLVLIGDSFGVAAGVRRPEGLQAALERTTGLTVFNASVAGVGPVQERWLLETVGLKKSPRAVLWLYFSGNDLTASYEPLLARRAGHATWAEAYPERRKPFLYLPDLVAKRLRATPPPACPAPLPGFELARPAGTTRALWFHPDSLRQAGWTADEWRAHPVWAPVQGELRAARDACAASGARFVLVYLPTKEEVYLPLVHRDPELALRTITALGGAAPPGTKDEIYDGLLANRHAQEEVLRAFCAGESIPFLPATPALEALAQRGELGYLVTDTHWQNIGQAALLEPLLEFLREQGVIAQ